jgi:hypothetical protein
VSGLRSFMFGGQVAERCGLSVIPRRAG